jgi:formylglycine-generating enzyme required for sulfatase activity
VIINVGYYINIITYLISIKMKKKFTILILNLILFSCSESYSQSRGMIPVQVTIHGTTSTLYQESHALLIGVSAYNNGLPVLPGVIDDISAVKAALEDNGFDVTEKMDPDNAHLELDFIQFIGKYGQSPDNRLLFYFAGHGHTVKMPYGEEFGYLCPIDAPNPATDSIDFQQKAMPMEHIMTFAKQIKSKHALFVFDACFSGSIFGISRAIPEIISYKAKEPVRQFITSGSAEESVPDKSIFCTQFIKGIQGGADGNKDGYVTGTELGEFLQNTVVNYSSNYQHPQYGKIRDPNLDKGDFVFVLNSANSHAILEPEQNIEKEQTHTHIGKLELTSQIPGFIFIDDAYVKYVNINTPVTLDSLTEGPHKIKISGEETQERKIMIYPGQTDSVTFEKKKQKMIASDNFNMIFVEGGTFQMGSEKGSSLESPVHQVTLNNFYIGQYEVTQKQWQDVMGNNPSKFNDCSNCPVENVSWDDVQEFLKNLNKKTGKNYRLPTEAEWEFAACGGNASNGYEYSGSKEPDEVAWYNSTSDDKTHPVGLKKPNELGIYDMSGNVWEWCSDFFDNNYYLDSPQKNPMGPTKSNKHILRGGSYECSASTIRTKCREKTFPNDKGSYLGFRICLSE